MIMHASNGCYLTQREDVPMSKRQFLTAVNIVKIEDAEKWKEITKKAKEEMQAKSAIIDVDNMTVESIDNVTALMNDIAKNINTVPMTKEEALDRKGYFPKWIDLIGQELAIEFRFQYGSKLYEVIQPHIATETWIPDEGTESLYKVVELDAKGTIDDPIPYDGNMELFNGLYYAQDNVLYLCIRDSGTPLYHALKDLIGIYVSVVDTNDTTTSEDEQEGEETDTLGTIDNPIEYDNNMELVNGLYYIQDGEVYLCNRDSGTTMTHSLANLVGLYVEKV